MPAFKRAADLGDPYGCVRYAICLESGGLRSHWQGGGPEDLWEAARYYKIAAEAPHNLPDAQFNFGVLSQRMGKHDVAFTMLERAALGKHEHPGALNNLGLMYWSGLAVDRDLNRARKLFERSAALGDPFGMANVGLMLAITAAEAR